MDTSGSIDLDLMRAAAALEKDPAVAAARASAVLALSPGNPDASLILAEASRRLGDPATAARLLAKLVESEPRSAVLQLELGRAWARAGESAEAIRVLEVAVQLNPTLADGWQELARLLPAAGDPVGADRAYAKYVHYAPDTPENRDALYALQEGRVGAAEAMLRERLAHSPGDVGALRLLADAMRRVGDMAQAETVLRSCLELEPAYARARFDLAQLLFDRHDYAAALAFAERLLAAFPEDLVYLGFKAMCLGLLERADEAMTVMDAAIAAHREDPAAWVQRGHLCRILARPALSVESFRRALELDPTTAVAYWALADLKTFRFDSADIEAMQAVSATLPVRDGGHVYLEFSLGKAYADLQDHAAAFRHYARGNALKRAGTAYDAEQTSAGTLASKAVYSASFFGERAGWGSPQQDPIFIIGLPRSGSTLIEQILSSHSAVEGTYELSDVRDIAFEASLAAQQHGEVSYPAVLTSLSREQIEACAARYLDRTRLYRRHGRARFIDKMPVNFSHIGMIQLMFPNAAIIDARRHPMACGMSCFKELFAHSNDFSYDLREIGLYYRDYVDLMQHIDTTLPGRVHRVHYEELVTDPEREVRRLLAYCGLPFEESCLRFYENRRVVLTVSSEQVRQPIFTSGVADWRHYEAWLEPLRSALGDLVEQYPVG